MSTSHMRDVVVVGGGPAGCIAATALALAGRDVLLLEAGEHPRPHVGESLLPGIIPILERVGALQAVTAAGFWPKTGSTFWDWGKTSRWDLWFADSDAYDHAWLVDRSRFDTLLFEHAAQSGVDVRSRAVAREALREDDRIVGLRWKERDRGVEHPEHARWVIDASGPAGCLARGLGDRQPIPGLQHQAMWAHFEGTGRLPPPRGHQAWFIAQPNQWWWCFPLGPELASVGVVQLDAAGRRTAPRRDFDAELATCPELLDVLGCNAKRCTPVRHERDWSYRTRVTAGPGWLAVGDAAGFIDPVLSSGVMLAMHSAWHAATAIGSILDGRPEHEALAAYQAGYREMFDDLLRMVRFYYQQNLHRDEYFWESKRILAEQGDTIPKPQKAFVLLTSGLVGNLPLQATHEEQSRRHAELVATASTEAITEPTQFICIHLRHDAPPARSPTLPQEVHVEGSALFILIEPAAANPGAPALFRTTTLHINAITPRHTNDPITDPTFAPAITYLREPVVTADDPPSPSLAAYWQRLQPTLEKALANLPDGFTKVRIFGQ